MKQKVERRECFVYKCFRRESAEIGVFGEIVLFVWTNCRISRDFTVIGLDSAYDSRCSQIKRHAF